MTKERFQTVNMNFLSIDMRNAEFNHFARYDNSSVPYNFNKEVSLASIITGDYKIP